MRGRGVRQAWSLALTAAHQQADQTRRNATDHEQVALSGAVTAPTPVYSPLAQRGVEQVAGRWSDAIGTAQRSPGKQS